MLGIQGYCRVSRKFGGGNRRALFSTLRTTSLRRYSPSVLRLALAGGFTAGLWLTYNRDQVAKACGIVAFVGKEPATPYLLEGLTILQNRGYDSAGVATISQDQVLTSTKFASVGSTSDSIDLVKANAPNQHQQDSVGIAHTRWATHGGKTTENAHPHLDSKNRVAVVHNGTIENYADLKKDLQKKGMKFASETDSEVIAQLIGHHLDQGTVLIDAVKATLAQLEGTWGLAIVHKENPDQIIAARNGSPIVVGIDKDRMFVASEHAAFSRYTNQYISLEDGEMAVISSSGVSLDLSRTETAPKETIELDPSPYEHWTIKEIMEQPEAISRTLGYGGRFDHAGNVKLGGMDDSRDRLLAIKHLLISGCGTSMFAGQYGAKLMRQLGCFDSVYTMDASEVGADAFPVKQGGLCVLSQSGETRDTVRSVNQAENLNIPRFSIINQVGSLIARSTKCGVYLNAGREHAVASTKAFTTQVAAMALVSGWFAQNRDVSSRPPQRVDELIQSVHRLPIFAGMTLRSREKCKELADKLVDKEHLFILGKGLAEPIAMEGALKIKEITYIHAEGYSGGALKHGPFALLEEGTPVILLVLNDKHAELMRVAAHEVRARGAYTVVITDTPKLAKGVSDFVIDIPHNGPMTALLGVIPLQMLAYELAIKRGINPDKPKNLAKAVTTD